MSVDDRLRESFGQIDRSWDEQVPSALTALTARHRRERAVRRAAGASLVAAAAVAAVLVAVSQGDEGSQRPDEIPPATRSPSPAPGDGTNPLAGIWVSEPLTRADVRRAARLAGDASDADAMLAGLPALPFEVVLYVDEDRNVLRATFRKEGRPEETTDEENVTVGADRLVLEPMYGDGENVHSYVLEGSTLTLHFVSTTEGSGDDGVAAEAWQRLLYDTAAFTSGT